MNVAFTVARQALLIAVPVVSSLAALPLPAKADTFSSSVIETTIDEFGQPVLSIEALSDTDANVLAVGPGSATATADAFAQLFPESWFGFSEAQTDGTGFNYQGVAIGETSLVGTFSLNEHQPFFFSFSSQIDLAASITNPLVETAAAIAALQFNLYNDTTNQLLDSFGVLGFLTPDSSSNPFVVELSDYVTLTDFPKTLTSNSTSSFVSSRFGGTYKRTFDGSLDLRLESFQVSAATVEAVPEPEHVFSTAVLLLMLPLARYWRNKRAKAIE